MNFVLKICCVIAFIAYAGPARSATGEHGSEGTFLSTFDTGPYGTYSPLAVSPGGRTYALVYNGSPRKYRLVRFNVNGTLDPLFRIETPSARPFSLQFGGKVLMGGSRYNEDGSVDPDFAPDPALSTEILSGLADGSVFAVQNFSATHSTRSLFRLNPDGSRDPGFTSDIGSRDITELKVLPDGDILVCSSDFFMVRLNPDGSLDDAFQTVSRASGAAVQPDGKILAIPAAEPSGGNQTILRRFNADGSIDISFSEQSLGYTSSVGKIYGCAVQGDGKIIVCGLFDEIGGVGSDNLARLLPDGRLDTGFQCDTSGIVRSVLIRDDGTALIAGSLSVVGGMPSGIISEIRLGTRLSEAVVRSDQMIRWERSGILPTLSEVRVESLAGNAGTWTYLGKAEPISEGWEISPDDLPPDTMFRLTGESITSSPASIQPATLISVGNVIPDLAVRHSGAPVPSGNGFVDFGDVVMGFDKELTIEIGNNGTDMLRNISCSLIGPAASDFTVIAQPATELWPLEKHGITVGFRPGATGDETIVLEITSDDPDEEIYTVSLRGAGSDFVSPIFASAQDIPISAAGFDIGGLSFGQLGLGFAPGAGTILTVIRNTGTDPILGTFPDLKNASLASADFGGVSYEFLVSYAGGDGNDLTLRLVGPGVIEKSFARELRGNGHGLAIQPDGKILVCQGSDRTASVHENTIFRFCPDGSPDTSFRPAITNLRVESIAVQPDGKILLAGLFREVSGVEQRHIARLLPDGRVDSGFTPRVNNLVFRVSVLRSGKILIGGYFSDVNGVPVTSLARLNDDGTLDETFQCDLRFSNSERVVYAMAEESGGKLWIGGVFQNPEDINFYRRGLVRLEENGALDRSVRVSMNKVSSIAIQADGKVLVGGSFISLSVGPTFYSRMRVARFNTDGTPDDFDPMASDTVETIAIQTDGKILLGGRFGRLGSRFSTAGLLNQRIGRIFPDGRIDTGFGSATDDIVSNAAITAEGNIVLTGEFRNVSDVPSTGIAVLRNGPGTDVLELSAPDRLHWTRIGALPELSSVSFEISTDSGASWTGLGVGTREADGWSLENLVLPTTGHVRANGVGVVSNRSSAGIRNHLLVGRSPKPIESWREAAFRFPFNEGDGANTYDADGDGVPNLMEYAFGLSPRDPASNALPSWTLEGNSDVIRFDAPDAQGVGITAEWSGTLSDGDWHPVDDESVDSMKIFRVRRDSDPARFFRLRAIEE